MEEDIMVNENNPEKMIVVTDPEGNRWLCDEEVDPTRDFAQQGCWKCGDEHFAFTRDD
ncbi:MAG: hypothetical protein R6V10_06325 [bacterium]